MSVEIYDNYDPKKAQHLDARLTSVATVAALPDPTVAANFIYEGAIAYVAGVVEEYYKCKLVSGVLTWVLFNTANLVVGTINITPATSALDLSLVTPAIADCYAVIVNIVGTGTSATLQSILNMPASDKQLTLYVTAGQTLNFQHTDYSVAGSNDIVLEDGFDMLLTGRSVGNESLTIKKHGVANCQWGAVQFMTATQWTQNLLNIAIINNLTSNSTSAALSANQGNVLNTLINYKQNVLSAGEKITIVPGALTTDPHTINNDPRNWVETVATGTITTYSTYLTSIFSGTSTEYRYIDLRNVGANDDMGLWVLPPKKDPTIIGNWVNLDAPNDRELTATYDFITDVGVSTALVLGSYYFKIKPSTLKGQNLGITWNTDGGLDSKVSFAFSKTGTYLIEADLALQVANANSASLGDYDVLIYKTDGVQLSTNPTFGTSGVVRNSVPALTVLGAGVTTTNRISSNKVSYTVVVTTVGVNNGFTFELNNNGVTAATFTTISIPDLTGLLKITKIS